MYKLDFKEYFCISKFLARFEQQDANIFNVKLPYTDPIKNIVALSIKYGEDEDGDSRLYEFLRHTKTIVLFLVFITVIAFSFLSIQKSINIKIYLVFGLIVPFIYLLYIAWKTLFYKFPNKEESSLVTFFAKKYADYDKRDTHVFKTFTTLFLVEIGVVYTFSIFLSTIFIFWAYSIKFYTESSYALFDPLKVWFGITSSHGNTLLPQHFFAIAITLSIFSLLVLKGFIWFFAKRNFQKAMRQASIQKAQTLLQKFSHSVAIQISSEGEKTVENFEIKKDKVQNIDCAEYDLLFYQFEFNKKVITTLELQNDRDLSSLNAKYYSFALFGEEEQDKKTLEKLQNLVIVATSAQTLPDNTFKCDMLTILKTNKVRQIWVIPLVEKDGILQKAYKGDYLYEEWQKQINDTIGDYRIRLYNEK